MGAYPPILPAGSDMVEDAPPDGVSVGIVAID